LLERWVADQHAAVSVETHRQDLLIFAIPAPSSTIRRTAVVDKTVGATPLKRIHEFTDNSRNLIRFVA
jgi:hypothetical protein